MKKNLVLPLVGLLLILLSTSCQKIDTGTSQQEVVALQSIPLKYGQLKAVTMTEQYPGWAQLWFQDEAGTICMVRVDWVKHEMMKEPLTITRTPASTERTKP